MRDFYLPAHELLTSFNELPIYLYDLVIHETADVHQFHLAGSDPLCDLLQLGVYFAEHHIGICQTVYFPIL